MMQSHESRKLLDVSTINRHFVLLDLDRNRFSISYNFKIIAKRTFWWFNYFVTMILFK